MGQGLNWTVKRTYSALIAVYKEGMIFRVQHDSQNLIDHRLVHPNIIGLVRHYGYMMCVDVPILDKLGIFRGPFGVDKRAGIDQIREATQMATKKMCQTHIIVLSSNVSKDSKLHGIGKALL